MVTYDSDLLLELLERWETLREQGTDATPEELCSNHPECLIALRRGIEALGATATVMADSDKQAYEEPVHELPGLVAGRYRPLRLLGHGGYGLVWLAIDEDLHRQVAIKIPRARRALSGFSLQEFMTEARCVASLRYPGIVSVHDVVRDEETCVIISEFIDGADLSVRLREGPLPWREAVSIGIGVSKSLAYAHEQGLIHRDIKPSNLLLDTHGKIHVCDFGIATTFHLAFAGKDRRLTLAYASPEQLVSERIDHRTDIWSLGVVLFELLTGRLPFQNEDPVRFKKSITFDPVPAMPNMPLALVKVIRKCLAKKPEDRFQSCHEVAVALDGVSGKPRKTVGWSFVGLLLLFVVAATQLSRFTSQPFSPDNLVENGDFSKGNKGFLTNYLYFLDDYGSNQSFCILANPKDGTTSPADKGDYGDHTTGEGLMMVVNGSSDPSAVVWSQKITVDPGTQYDFSMWISSWFPDNPATIDVRFNGVSIGKVDAPSGLGLWVPFNAAWDSGDASSVTIELFDVRPADIGSDFALDDISFRQRN
jgi:serine/threonine protein kinase